MARKKMDKELRRLIDELKAIGEKDKESYTKLIKHKIGDNPALKIYGSKLSKEAEVLDRIGQILHFEELTKEERYLISHAMNHHLCYYADFWQK